VPENVGQTPVSQNGGHSGGQFESDSNSVATLKLRAIADLNQAVTSLKAWQGIAVRPEGVVLLENLQAVLVRLECA